MQPRDLFNEFPLGRGEVVPIALQRLLGEPLDVHADAGRAERLLPVYCWALGGTFSEPLAGQIQDAFA